VTSHISINFPITAVIVARPAFLAINLPLESIETISSSDEEYLSYLKALSGKSIYGTDIGEFSADDKILTLSTCTYEVNDGRLLIHAKLIK